MTSAIATKANVAETIKQRVEEQRDEILKFFREIVAIPSMDSQLKDVGERIGEEMKKLKFDEVRFDKMGNILGRIGNGKRVLRVRFARRYRRHRRSQRLEVGSVPGEDRRRQAVRARHVR